MKTMFRNIFIIVLCTFLYLITASLVAENVINKSSRLRTELIKYLIEIRPMVYNFPCSPYPDCDELRTNTGGVNIDGKEVKRINFVDNFVKARKSSEKAFNLHSEGNYVIAYSHFLNAQAMIDHILTDLTRVYIERAEEMLREAVAKKAIEDENDRTASEIMLDYSASSHKRKIFKKERIATGVMRSYNAKEVNWVKNRHRIYNNLKKGYQHLGIARRARQQSIDLRDRDRRLHSISFKDDFIQRIKKADVKEENVNQPTANNDIANKPVYDEKNRDADIFLATKKRIIPKLRRERIRLYLNSIRMSKRTKTNAAFIFRLKYPYDNYSLYNPFGKTEKGRNEEVSTPKIGDVRMNWSENPLLLPIKLHPVYDLRITARFRRDMVDIRDEIYTEAMDRLIRLKFVDKKPESFQKIDKEKQN